MSRPTLPLVVIPADFELAATGPDVVVFRLMGAQVDDWPIPSRWHRCRPVEIIIMERHTVDICACGAQHVRGDGVWTDRHLRRRQRKEARRGQ